MVRIAFALDCYDREIISHIATTGGITDEMVRDLMVESIEPRFRSVVRLPHTVEWLSDNDGCYTATETISFAKDMGFISCFTPVRSPESNGMAEVTSSSAGLHKTPISMWRDSIETQYPHG